MIIDHTRNSDGKRRLSSPSPTHPRRDLALRYAEGSAPAPVAPTAQQGKSNRRSELDKTWGQVTAPCGTRL
jgi:hypothetical protein